MLVQNSNLIYIELQDIAIEGETSGIKPVQTPGALQTLSTIHSLYSGNRITYTNSELLDLKHAVDHNGLYYSSIPDQKTRFQVGKLKINRNRKRGKKGGKRHRFKYRDFTRTSNCEILVKIATEQFAIPSQKVKISTINVQSLKSKIDLVDDYIRTENIDICVLTETWLKQEDEPWIQACDLSKNGLQMDVFNRPVKKGGGLAVVHRSNIKLKKLDKGKKKSWQLKQGGNRYSLIGIYRPPYSDTNRATIKNFIDEFNYHW